MAQQLSGKRVAIVVTDGFEQDELEKPRQALEEAGAKTEVISPKSGKVNTPIGEMKSLSIKSYVRPTLMNMTH
jgi:putative intracellular protease/amidase